MSTHKLLEGVKIGATILESYLTTYKAKYTLTNDLDIILLGIYRRERSTLSPHLILSIGSASLSKMYNKSNFTQC